MFLLFLFFTLNGAFSDVVISFSASDLAEESKLGG